MMDDCYKPLDEYEFEDDTFQEIFPKTSRVDRSLTSRFQSPDSLVEYYSIKKLVHHNSFKRSRNSSETLTPNNLSRPKSMTLPQWKVRGQLLDHIQKMSEEIKNIKASCVHKSRRTNGGNRRGLELTKNQGKKLESDDKNEKCGTLFHDVDDVDYKDIIRQKPHADRLKARDRDRERKEKRRISVNRYIFKEE